MVIGIGRAAYQLLIGGGDTVWGWGLLALVPALAFFIWLFVGNVARAPLAPRAVLVMAALASIGLLLDGRGCSEIWSWVGGVGLLGAALYEFWYSSFGERSSDILLEGKTLPALVFEQADGSVFETAGLHKPMVMVFYRGNWCPLCMAQVREIAGQYQQLADKGVEVMLISPQPHTESAALADKFDAPMQFLVDKDNAMAEKLGIKAENGLPAGLQALGYDSDTVMPTVVITDAKGTILLADLTDNYRVRPEPDVFMEVLAKAGI